MKTDYKMDEYQLDTYTGPCPMCGVTQELEARYTICSLYKANGDGVLLRSANVQPCKECCKKFERLPVASEKPTIIKRAVFIEEDDTEFTDYTSDGFINYVHKNGPKSVMKDDDEHVERKMATKEMLKAMTTIFIRNDGWTLGASAELAMAACTVSPDEWLGVLQKPNPGMMDLKSWLKSRRKAK